MVLSVLNIQEAYAKALLVDREALREAQAQGDVLAGHEVLLDAYRIDVRPLWSRARAELGAAEDPIAALRSSGRSARMAQARRTTRTAPGDHPMSTAILVDAVSDLWPSEPAAEDVLSQLVLASTCWAPIARSRTSAAATPRPRARRRPRRPGGAGHVGQGLGQRPGHDGPEHFTGLRLDEVLPIRPREMSDEDMVAHLSRCQLDPRMRAARSRRCCAFVPPPSTTHPDGINVLAGTATASASCRRRSATRPPGSPTSARAHALQAGR